MIKIKAYTNNITLASILDSHLTHAVVAIPCHVADIELCTRLSVLLFFFFRFVFTFRVSPHSAPLRALQIHRFLQTKTPKKNGGERKRETQL